MCIRDRSTGNGRSAEARRRPERRAQPGAAHAGRAASRRGQVPPPLPRHCEEPEALLPDSAARGGGDPGDLARWRRRRG
eukprot:15472991-Alexandrium_andersonii.AAC.1